MRDQSSLLVLWRRRRLVAAVLIGFVIVAGVLSKVLPKVYSASSTLIVVQNSNVSSFDAVQAAQVTARTYASIVSAPAIAAQVAGQIGGGATTSSVNAAVSVSPVVETQLLKITAEDHSAAYAQKLANTYSAVVIQYIQQHLGAAAGATVALANPATRPTTPVRPKPSLYVLIAAILGLAIGIGLALLLDRLDTRLRTADEVRARFQEMILARMPLQSGGAAASEASMNAMEEAFGLLRANLRFASPDRPLDVIAVTSAREAEGKTTCVTHMAQAMAEVGSHVIVVDGDLRHPALQQRVMPESSAPVRPGLSDYLVGAAALEEIVHETGREEVELVPTGALPSSPAAFLESHPVKDALHELATKADLVLVDCPPLSAGADASIVAANVDGVIVVVDLERCTEKGLADVLRQLAIVRTPVVGLVLNRDRGAELLYPYAYAGQSTA